MRSPAALPGKFAAYVHLAIWLHPAAPQSNNWRAAEAAFRRGTAIGAFIGRRGPVASPVSSRVVGRPDTDQFVFGVGR